MLQQQRSCPRPDMHYTGGSYRWTPTDPRISLEVWQAQVRAHREQYHSLQAETPMPGQSRCAA